MQLRTRVAIFLLRILAIGAIKVGLPMLKLLAVLSGDKPAFARYMMTTLGGMMGSVDLSQMRMGAANMGLAREAVAYTDAYAGYQRYVAAAAQPEPIPTNFSLFVGQTVAQIRAATNPADGVSYIWLDFEDGNSLQFASKELGVCAGRQDLAQTNS